MHRHMMAPDSKQGELEGEGSQIHAAMVVVFTVMFHV